MSIETRSNNALFKRAEQLKRWEESDTNREPVSPKRKSRKVKFSSGCVFLAACAAGDKDEVLKLREKGADINTANVDGLTALHQACIDDNLDMVEFLVEQGADVNRGDNEGWTPLHATASCGFMYIAKYLIEKGADVAAVNTDGELPLDIAEGQKMEEFLKDEIRKRGIDCDAARNDEETAMLKDAKEWLATRSHLINESHNKTGATPLHVASAKGYIEVMKILLQSGADIDSQDVDGWSPIHAAAHWGQESACRLLAEYLADMDLKNYVGQTPFDLADSAMLGILEDIRAKQNKEEVNKRKAKKRAETLDRTIEIDSQSQVKKVKVEITEEDEDATTTTTIKNKEVEQKNKINSQSVNEKIPSSINKETEVVVVVPKPPLSPKSVENSEEEKMPWRQQSSPINNANIKPTTRVELNSPEKKEYNKTISSTNLNNENEITLRRTKSFQNDESFYVKYKALHARIEANNVTASSVISPYNIINPSVRPKSDIILTNNAESHYRNIKKDEKVNDVVSTTISPTKTTSSSTSSSPQSQNNQSAFRRSFVPPVRDEESETQRKAHAKRVRETRRSTQGVTLEEIKSAEQLVKSKNQPNNNNNNNDSEMSGGDNPAISVSVTISTGTPTVITKTDQISGGGGILETQHTNGSSSSVVDVHTNSAMSGQNEIPERRPSWRLKVDGGSKFKLEDATKPDTTSSNASSFVRRLNPITNSTTITTTTTTTRPSSAPIETAETTVTIPLRRPKSLEEKDQDKENDARNAQATLATQAAIQRRRRPKRRSTGVVSFDNVEDIVEQDKDPAGGGDNAETAKLVHESGSERSSRSRIGSTVDIRNENGEIDYKKLYEEQLAINERLKDKQRKSDEELRETKQTLEKLNLVTSKNSLSELEKRERRAMERKLSEMEEELKNLENLKTENQRLKDENGALIRVISKLSK